MDKSIQYAQVMSNFDSVYNASPNFIHQSTVYIPMSSSIISSSFSNRSSSPLFHRSKSPPSRSPISTRPGPKFNFDLYKMDEHNNEYEDYSSSSYRSTSPSSSRIIHHHPIHSPPTSQSQALSKLRLINDELCDTLARSEITDQSQQPPSHYHIHHYPLSQDRHHTYRSRSPSTNRPSSTEFETSPKLHKARVTYKVHIPRRRRQDQHRKLSLSRFDQDDISSSDLYSSDDTMTVDLYPTRDQGFVKQIRNRPNHKSPWVVDGRSIRRSSYSDASTSRQSHTPKGPYYGDKPIKSHSRLARGKEHPSSSSRHQSSFVTSRIRPDSTPLYESDQFRESTVTFSNTTPVWRSNGSIERQKFISSHGPSSRYNHTFDPRSKSPSNNFERKIRSEYDIRTRKRLIDETESEPIPQRRMLSNRIKIRTSDPKMKKRIANAESKVKSAWEPTTTGIIPSTIKERKSSISYPVKQTTITTPSQSRIKSVPTQPTTPEKKFVTEPSITANTGRSSLNDVRRKPMFQSTPTNRSVVDGNDDSVADLFENESQTSERLQRQESPRPPPRIEKTRTPSSQQPRKPSTELPKTSILESNKGTKTNLKDGLLRRENDAENIQNQNQNPTNLHSIDQTPSPTSEIKNNNDNEETSNGHSVQPIPLPRPKVPTPERKAPPLKQNNKNDESAVDDDNTDENDEEVARSFDINKWLDDASKNIINAAKKGNIAVPSTPPRPPPKANVKSPPRRIEQPPPPSSESPDHNLYKPPFGPKKKDQKPVTPPPVTTTNVTDEVDDFFS